MLIVDEGEMSPQDLALLEADRKQWSDMLAERQRRDRINARIGVRLTTKATPPWKSVRDVALIAIDEGHAVSQSRIDAEFADILESARLGQLSQGKKIGVLIALRGMKPFLLTKAFIDSQSEMAKSIDQEEPATGCRTVATLVLKTAWMTEWAAEVYLKIAQGRRNPNAEKPEYQEGWDLSEEGKPAKQIAVLRAAKQLWPDGRPFHLLNKEVNREIKQKVGGGKNLVSARTIDRALGREKK